MDGTYLLVMTTDLSLDEILGFFSRNQIPILPCYGVVAGICTCRKGAKCPSPGKHPLMFRWQMIATCDPQIVKSWIGTGTKPVNLAIRTGMRNQENGKYLVGADLDLVDHPMKERLIRHSRTLTQQSGSGGDHAFYWSRLPVRNSVELVDEKMDIRGSGGIMVIAPSQHKSGNQYRFTCDLRETEIQDLPDFLEQRLRVAVARTRDRHVEPSVPRTASSPSQAVQFWGNKSVSSIRTALLNGEKISVGARNATMHRLLSSDRARGVPTTAKLLIKAKEYLSGFEDPDSFLDDLDGIVKSVMRYPAYNNSHEKVNELYLGWLGKKGYKKEHTLDALEALDKKFFDSLEPGSSIDSGISLREIAEVRARFMRESGLVKFATYRPQLLAKKLTSLGIQRKRTSKANNWQVKFGIALKPLELPCENREMTTQTLAMSNTTEELKDETKKTGLKDGDIIDYKGQKVRVELVKTQVKNTVHPREHLYQGRTGYDYNKALMALMSRITEEQMENLELGFLVMNKEETREWMETIQVGDVIGVVSEKYRVVAGAPLDPFPCLPVNKVKAVPNKPGEYQEASNAPVEFLSEFVLDHARELGLLDILWRDGKPFGVPETRDMTVVLLHDLEDPKQPSRKKKTKK